jgi:hypothetical protein
VCDVTSAIAHTPQVVVGVESQDARGWQGGDLRAGGTTDSGEGGGEGEGREGGVGGREGGCGGVGGAATLRQTSALASSCA